MVSFAQALSQNQLHLQRDKTETLQVNLGLLCNQVCKHCHLDAGPKRSEVMDRETMCLVAAYATSGGFHTLDITGGAPEMNPHLPELINLAAGKVSRIMLRSNLTVLTGGEHGELLELLKKHQVDLVASFPSLSPGQLEAQRGKGVFEDSVAGLQLLNRLGWGRPGSGLGLDLVANPAGAFLPPDQNSAERRYRDELGRRWDISFNNLFTLANVPLGRFRQWLQRSGNYQSYLDKLASGFNPCTVDNLMCRSLVSVSWDGYLYDCDFNLAAGIPMGGQMTHLSQMQGPPPEGALIPLSEHCYTCTAGSGFT